MKKYKNFEWECNVSYNGHCKMYTAARRAYISKDKQKRLNRTALQAQGHNKLAERGENRQTEKIELRRMKDLFNLGSD